MILVVWWQPCLDLCNISFERVEHFRYLETTVTHPDSVQEEIKS